MSAVTKINGLPELVAVGSQEALLQAFRSVSQARDLPAATQALVDELEGWGSGLAGASLFLGDHRSKRMIPHASRRFSGHGGRLQISQGLLRQAWKDQRVVWSRAQGQAMAGADLPLLAVLPMLYATGVSGLLHLEYYGTEQAEAAASAELVLTLLEICAPVLELLKVRGGDQAVMRSMAQSINASIEAKDTYTSGHSERVARFTDVLAAQMGMEAKERELLFISALCHDVGKIGVSEQILRKPSLLSSDEYHEMQRHPLIGAAIVKDLPGAGLILGGIKHHHERWDGTGYPGGLVGEAIPLFARIIAVTDAFDAMTSGRSYSGFVDQQKAVEHLVGCDDLFDPQILEALQEVHEQGILTTRTGTNTHNRAAAGAGGVVVSGVVK